MAIQNAKRTRCPNVVFLIGNTGSGKSSVARKVMADAFELFQIDEYYQKTPRADTSIEWTEDANYRRKAYGAMKGAILDALRNGTDVIIETTGASSYAASLFKSLKRTKDLTILVV